MTDQVLRVRELRGAVQGISLSQHAASGAIFAALIAALWVLHYLVTTRYGIFDSNSIILLKYVTGQEHNLQIGSEATFVIMTRFISAFGLSWAPITILIALVRK